MIAQSAIVYGGFLFSMFLVLVFNSFYPIQSFLMAFLLGKFSGHYFKNQGAQDTIMFVAVITSMMLYLNDNTVPKKHKNLFGVDFHNPKIKSFMYVVFLLLLLNHVGIQFRRIKPNELTNALVWGVVVGYTGFSMCKRTRGETTPSLVWFMVRVVLGLMVLALFLMYVYDEIKTSSSLKKKNKLFF